MTRCVFGTPLVSTAHSGKRSGEGEAGGWACPLVIQHCRRQRQLSPGPQTGSKCMAAHYYHYLGHAAHRSRLSIPLSRDVQPPTFGRPLGRPCECQYGRRSAPTSQPSCTTKRPIFLPPQLFNKCCVFKKSRYASKIFFKKGFKDGIGVMVYLNKLQFDGPSGHEKV